MVKKRYIAFLTAMIMSLSMSGCSTMNNHNSQSTGSTNTVPSITTPDVTFVDDVTEPSHTDPIEDTNIVGTEHDGSNEEVTEPASEHTTKPTDSVQPTQPDDPEPTNPTSPTESTSPQPTDPKPTDPPAPTNPPHAHSYKATVVAPTCTNKGYTEYKCSCGDSYKDNYKNALGHNWTKGNTEAATCSAGGYTEYKCNRCGASEKRDKTNALGHDYKVTSNGTATCTSGGYTEKKCTRCGDTQRTQTAALGHDYQETGFTSATCTTPFTVNYKCSRCGATSQETSGEPLGHSWVHHDAETHWVHGIKCYCGAIFWTYEEWSDHFDSFSYAEKEIRDLHAGYKNYDEEIIDKPAYSQCSRCGLIEYY